MYQLADKNKVMSLFHKGQSVSQIRLKSNVSKSTLYRWKAEYDMTGKIIGYVMKGKISEAKQAIFQFQEEHKKSSVLLTSKVINQLICFEYLNFAKELAEESLKQNPNDTLIIGQLVTIAKQKGDWEEVERLCRERLELDPKDKITKKQLKTARKMQKRKRKIEEEKERNEIKQSDDKPKKDEKQNTQQNIQIIRKQIQAGTFSLESIEARQKEMQKMGIDEVQRNILIAEAYACQNMPKQTKAYLKKALQGTQEPELQKAIKALLEIAQTKKKKPSHINPWNMVTTITFANKIGQTDRSPKELDEK